MITDVVRDVYNEFLPTFMGGRNDYTGPYVSDRKFQSSVVGSKAPHSRWQERSKKHDAEIALAKSDRDRYDADQAFISANRGDTWIGDVVAYLVEHYGPGAGKAYKKNLTLPSYVNNIDRENLRRMVFKRGGKRSRKGFRAGSSKYSNRNVGGTNMPQGNVGNPAKIAKKSGHELAKFSAPAVFGTGVSLQAPVVTRRADGINVKGSEFIGNAVSPPQTNGNTAAAAAVSSSEKWFLSNIIHLNPCYFANARLGIFCLTYEKFRFKRIVVNYIPAVGTSTQGNVLLEYQPKLSECARYWTGNQFLNNVMSGQGTTLMPIWENFRCAIPLEEADMKYVVPDNSVDLNDQSNGDIYLYQNSKFAAEAQPSPGYWVIEYDIDFSSAIFTPRQSAIPYADTSAWQYGHMSLKDVTPTVNTQVLLKKGATAGIPAYTLVAGALYKFVIDVTNSSTNVATTSEWQIINQGAVGQPWTMVDGCSVYIKSDGVGTDYYMYSCYNDAVGNAQNGVAYGAAVAQADHIILGWLLMINNAPQLTLQGP